MELDRPIPQENPIWKTPEEMGKYRTSLKTINEVGTDFR
jgi:hypothetical protein